MHPETKKLTQKHALSNTNTDRKSKATTKPWFSRLLRHPARKWSGSILGQSKVEHPTEHIMGHIGDKFLRVK